MKIYITDNFKKKYLSKIRGFNTLNFLNKFKTYNSINLKYPYFKFKFNLFGISYRGVFLTTNSGNIVPLILCMKKDKNCGENIIWEKFESKIIFEQSKALIDIKNGKYEVF